MVFKSSMKLVLIAGCLVAALMIQTGFPAATLAAKQGGILKIGVPFVPQKAGDPHNTINNGDQCIGSHVFNQLINWVYDNTSHQVKVQPALALKWERSADGKIWTFYLRQGVRFHDGTAFNAQAVKINLDRLTAAKPKATYGRDLRPIVERTEVIDAYTVKVYLKIPAALFLNYIGEYNVSMISPAALKKYGDKIARHPVGTGPFKVKQWVSGEKIELEANQAYWAGRPHLDGIVFRSVPDNSARVSMLQTGELDAIWGVPVQDHARLKKSGFDVITYPTAVTLRLFLDCGVGPTQQVAVRQAMNLAIDKQSIVRDILQGVGQVADSPVSPYSWGYYACEKPEYNPDKAKKILEDAGWADTDGDGIREKDGKKLQFTLYSPPPGRYTMGGEIMMAIQQFLHEVGFDCKVKFEEIGSLIGKFYRTLDKTHGDAFFFDYSSRSDGMFILKRVYSGAWYPKYPYFNFYRNPEYDKLYKAAVVELDNNKRLEQYKKMQEIWARDQPMTDLYLVSLVIVKKKNVHGLSRSPLPPRAFMHAAQAWIE